jgi:hypothetical protein
MYRREWSERGKLLIGKPGFEDIGLSTGINQTPEEKY